MSRATTVRLDLGALVHNLRRVRAAAPGRRVAAAVKADGYGHGLLRVAAALDADAFAVASIEEALSLREAGVARPVLLLEGVFEAAELPLCARYGLEIAVHHPEQLRMLDGARVEQPLRVWLKIDTGMHRLGLAPDTVAANLQRLRDCPAVDARQIGFMSHLARADERDGAATRQQLQQFEAATAGLLGARSLANSAAILGWPDTHFEQVRPGIMLYGASPFVDGQAPDEDLRPVMTLSTRLISIKRLLKGEPVGYGGTWSCPEDMDVGVAAVGYGDGYPRHAPSGTPVLIGGREAALIGRVSMDMITLDLRRHPEARIGDPVLLWGEGLPVERIAAAAGTISYTLLCGVTARVRREVLPALPPGSGPATSVSKGRTVYACSECGAQASKWSGQCGDCGAWNTLQEALAVPTGKGGAKAAGYAGYAGQLAGAEVRALAEVDARGELRQSCGSAELDRVLGGGLVGGSVTLIGGDPGIGKSTLLLQVLVDLATRQRTLYVSGEESPQQISLRAQRLQLSREHLRLLPEINVERILASAEGEQPGVMVIDSIQTVFTERLQSAPGSVAQVRESAAQLVRYAKSSGTALFLVGHVTKEGAIAGPRVLEHMVDTVLYFEGDPSGRLRVLRAVKNRYGPVNELGVFAMTEHGLKEVSNPSAIFLSRHDTPVAGSVIMVTREGTRPLLVEIQALVDECHGGNPRRVTLGLEQNRLAMLLAVLHRHGGVAMYDQDVYVNAVGGVRINETAADLAVLLAALSSFRDRPLPNDLVVFGEVGLAGEIRPVPNGEERLREAAKHGFKQAIVPRANLPRRSTHLDGLELRGVSRLSEVMGSL